MKINKSVLFFCHYFPPLVSGSSVLMGNLLGSFTKGSLHVIRGQPPVDPVDLAYHVNVPQTMIELPHSVGRLCFKLLPLLFPVFLFKALQLHKRHNFAAIYACYPSLLYLEFAYWFHRLTGLPLYVHMHDMGSDNETRPFRKKLMTTVEKRILRAAKIVFVITDEAGDHFHQKYGVKTMTLDHSVDWSMIKEVDRFVEIHPNTQEYSKVAFSGTIYATMNYDSLLRINEAVQQLSNVEMVIYSAALDVPISGERLRVQCLGKNEVLFHLQQCDLICAPLAFETHADLEVRTVFPTKCLEYFVCGRPILVHAPPDSFLARDARKKGWGYVVDTPDVEELKLAIQMLLHDEALQRRLVTAAWKEARRRDARVVSKKLQKVLGVWE